MMYTTPSAMTQANTPVTTRMTTTRKDLADEQKLNLRTSSGQTSSRLSKIHLSRLAAITNARPWTQAVRGVYALVVGLTLVFMVAISIDEGTLAHAQSNSVTPILANDANAKAQAGELTIIDIRTPEEWKQTGVAQVAVTNSMHVQGFMQRLEQMTGGNRDQPVALICAVGGRSGALTQHLKKQGYTNVYDVVDGMLGSNKGKGWLDGGLPTRRYEEQ